MIKTAACVPAGAQISVRRNTSGILEQAREMHKIPRHESGVALGKVVLRAA